MMNMVKQKIDEEYLKALEEELCASLEREKRLSNENLSFVKFLGKKIKRTKLYTDIISNPDSKAGKIARMPRTLFRIARNPEVRKEILQKKTAENLEEKYRDTNFLSPWIIDMEKRKEIAEKAIKAGRKLVVYYVEKPDASTFRYRCFNTFEATLKSKKWQAVYFFKKELPTIKELIPKSSLLVFGRQSGQEKSIDELIKVAHTHKIKVGFDIDDLVFDKKYLDIVLDTIDGNSNRGYWIVYFNGVKSIAERVDFFITTNDFLKGKLEESFNKPCQVIRNSVNSGQLSASRAFLRFKNKQDSVFRIGYFSGSPTHFRDFMEAEPELIKFLNDHDDAELNVVGFMRFSKEANRLVRKGRIKFLPLTDFRKLQKLMSEVDVNIAPLVINDFTNCKSELKFFEAALVKTTTIASPTYAFKKVIHDGQNGFLANKGDWYGKLQYLYSNPEENKKVAEAALKYAVENYSGKTLLAEIEEAYGRSAK